VEYLWALLNSPVANAYVATHTDKRDVTVGMVREIPAPSASPAQMQDVAQTVRSYFQYVAPPATPLAVAPSPERAKELHLAIDAAILRLYDRPPRLERQLLDYFAGHARQGVPFHMDRYYPPDFGPCVPLWEYLSEDFRTSTVAEFRRRVKEDPPSAELVAALEVASRAYGDRD
jgi:hypothetical protein